MTDFTSTPISPPFEKEAQEGARCKPATDCEDLSGYDDVFKYLRVHGNIDYHSIIARLEGRAGDFGRTRTSTSDSRLDRATFQSFSMEFLTSEKKLSPETDYIVKLVEDVLLLVRDLNRAHTKSDYVLAIVTFAKLRSTGSLTNVLLEQWDRIMVPTFQAGEINHFSKMRDILDNYEKVKTLPIFKKLYKFLLYCLGTSLFEKLGVKFNAYNFLKIEKAAVKKDYSNRIDFIHCVLDTSLFMCETGYQCMVTGTLDSFLHDENSYEVWHRDAELLKKQARYISNPEPHGFTVFDFLNRLDSAIEKGTSIVKFQASDPVNQKVCRYTLNELNIIRADALTKRLAQQDRKAPFSVLVSGGSSVGKSTFTKMLYYHFGKRFKLPTEPEYRYVRNPFDQYWTNFNSSQWCVQLDDIAFLHPGNSTACDPSLMEMLQVVNNVPYVPTQADIADKGKTPLRARFVIATTNTEKLNAETYFACPLAVQRRLPYIIELVPKKEYLRDGAFLDTSKLPKATPGSYPDFWKIRVKKVIPNQKVSTHMGQTAMFRDLAEYTDVIEFLKWFNSVAQDAEGVQQASMDCDQFMSDVNLCECGVPTNVCSIHSAQIVLQAEEEITSTWIEQVMSRRETPVEEDPCHDPASEFVWSNVMRQIAKMNFTTRVVVLFYYSFLYCFHKSLCFRIVANWFFGRWYWMWVVSYLLHYPEVRHITLYLVGYRTYRNVCRNKTAIIIAASITTMLSMYKAFAFIQQWRNEKPEKLVAKAEVQGVSEDRGERPVTQNDKLENVWYKDVYECTTFDVPAPVLSRAAWSRDDCLKHLRRNLVSFTARYQVSEGVGKRVTCKATCLVGRIYVVNNHSIRSDVFELDVVFQSGKDGVSENITLLVTPSQITRVPERDLMFIELPIPPRKDIRSFFPWRSFEGRFDGEYIGRNGDGSIYRNNVIAPKLEKAMRKVDESLNVNITSDMWSGKYANKTQIGDCGSLLISYTSMGPVILGMHVLGLPENAGYALAICQEDLAFLNGKVMAGSSPTLAVGDYKQTLGDLHHKSPVRYIEKGTLEVYGSFTGFRSKKTSSVCKTFMSDLAVEHGYVRNTSAPMMNSWVPWRKALLDMTRPVTHIDVTVLRACAESFTQDIFDGLSDEDLAGVMVYDDVTALNGCPGLAYVDKLNRNTSAGFPFKKSKKFFLNAVEGFGELQHPVEATKEIMDEVSKIIECYESGNVYQPVFTASLKDEPTSLKKCKEGKTRVFCGAPMPWSIVVRKYFLSIVRLIQKNRFLFESGPGTIAQSKEWDDIYRYLVQFGLDRMIVGDYEKFDKRMPACVILEAFGILIAIMEKAGWPERDLMVVRGIAEDVANCTIDFNGCFIRAYGSNPSGHPLTVIINGIANSLYVRYCYLLANPSKECRTFKTNVALITYGDDMGAGVSKSIDWFNHTVMRDTLASIDIGFTMADKETESVPFIHINDATFLRRSWRFEPELGYHVCPIEHASIDKMMTMCVKSKTISLELQAIEVMHTVVREYFWYGKETFHEKRALMEQFVQELNLEPYQKGDFPTWEQLVGEFKAASQLR
nr:MAG: structural polyprotein [Crogonang virus 13]